MNLAGYEIAWTPAAEAHFYKLYPWVAMVVDRAVIHFVERGEGVVEHVPPYERLR